VVERHHTQLIHQQRIAIAHRIRRIERFVCERVIRQHNIFHAHKHQREM
jgi:hypothetical protein